MESGKKREFWISWFLGFSAILSIVTLTMLSPALPSMAIYYHTVSETMQNLISMNMFISGFSVLIFGSLANSLGRKRLYLIGVGLLGSGALASAFSTNLTLLFLFQGIQSMGSSACSVLPLVIVKELYPGVRGTKILSVWGIILPMAPALAGFLGGALTEFLSWRAVFFLLVLGAGVLSVGIKIFLPESRSLSKTSGFSVRSHLHAYKSLLLNRQFIKIALLPGLGFAGLSAYTATAPFVFIRGEGMAPSDYGLYLFITFFGMLCGSLFVRSFVERWSLYNFVRWAVFVMIGAGGLFLLAASLHSRDPILYSVIMMLYGMGFGALLTSGTSLSLDLAGERKGHAAALLRCLQFTFISGGTFIAGYLYQGTFLRASFLVLGFAVLSGVGFWRAKNNVSFSEKKCS